MAPNEQHLIEYNQIYDLLEGQKMESLKARGASLVLNTDIKEHYLNHQKALEGLLARALDLLNHTQFKDLYYVIGNIYVDLWDYHKAKHYYLQALELDVPYQNGLVLGGSPVTILNNLGIAEYGLNNDEASVDWFCRATALNPGEGNLYWNSAYTFLRQWSSKKLENEGLAWNIYDFRLRQLVHEKVLDTSAPLWQHLTHETNLVLLEEQGHGDRFMLARYFDLLKPYCDNLTIQCGGRQLREFFESFGWKTCERSSHVRGSAGVPIFSLPGLFGDVDHHWIKGVVGRGVIGGGNKPSVIVEWTGSTGHKNNINRSCDPELFKPLSNYCDLYNISPETRDCPSWITHIPSDSWKTSCELIEDCDLVISVDTSIVHLAGSMNKPVWMLQPLKFTDWRWGDHTCGTWNRWYPNVAVFRNNNNWQEVFNTVDSKLKEALDC